jgi:hypothetical protein
MLPRNPEILQSCLKIVWPGTQQLGGFSKSQGLTGDGEVRLIRAFPPPSGVAGANQP